MALDDKDDQLATTEAPVEQDNSSVTPSEEKTSDARFNRENEGKNSVRHLIKKNIDDINKNLDKPPTSKERRVSTPKVEAKPELKEVPVKQEPALESKPEASKPAEPDPVKASQEPTVSAPAALTKEEKAVWDNVPPEIQKAFLRREADTQKGVEQLKAKYQPIEDVLAPLKPMLQQSGLTEAHAVRQLFDWHRALSSPNKAMQADAFRSLAQAHRFDLGSLNPQPQPMQNIAPVAPPVQQGDPQQPPQIDPLKQIEQLLDQRLQPVNQQLNFYQQEMQRQRLDAANNELAGFAKDKPHFDKVRVRMAEILSTAAQFGRPVTLQDAYDEAVWGMPDLRTEMLHEQEERQQAAFKTLQEENVRKNQETESERLKKEAEAVAEAKRKEQEALERARRASVSPRGTAPVSAFSGSKGPKKAQSVGDTVRAAMKEFNSAI